LPVMKRREMIEHLLGISIFYDIKGLVKDKLKSANYDKQVATDKLDLEVEKLAMNEKYQDNTNQDKQKIIDDLGVQFKDKNREAILLAKENKDAQDYIDELEGKYDDGLDAEIHKHNNRQRDILNKIKDIEKNTKFFQLNDECPTCTQEINDDIKGDVIANNDLLLDKLRTGEEINETKLLQLSTLSDNNTTIRDSISFNRTDIRDNDTLICRLKKEMSVIQSSIKSYQENDSDDRQHDIIDDIEENNINIKKLQARLKKFEELIDYYKIMGVILNDDGVKSLIIKKYLPLFNRDINDYLNKFGLNVQFILDEQFNETILSRGRDNFSYNSFSEGQKLRIDLALMMSFRNLCKIKNSVDSNLLIMDEIFDSSLNQKGVDAFVDMLQEQKDIHTFIITHTPEKIHDRFDNTIEVQLLNNFSELKKEIHNGTN